MSISLKGKLYPIEIVFDCRFWNAVIDELYKSMFLEACHQQLAHADSLLSRATQELGKVKCR